MKKFYIIVNPAGGKKKGLRILDQVRPQFEKHKAKINVLKLLMPVMQETTLKP